MTLEEWKEIELFITNLLWKFNNKIDKRVTTSIVNYIKEDEFEMAFELLLLELIRRKIRLENIDEIETVAKQLRLDKESVDDNNFWNTFQTYIKQYI